MDWKRIGKKLLFPPPWVILVLCMMSATALVVVFIKGWDSLPVASLVYVIAFYSLAVLCIFCWKVFPGYYKGIKGKVYENEYAKRFFTDAAFKTHVSLYGSLVINLVYVTVNAVSAVIYHTYWFAIFAVYYAIMAILRFLLVRYVGRNQIGKSRMGELKCSRLCAFILMTVNLALSAVVLMMVYFNRGFTYQGFLIYVMAMYTFYITITAIIDMVKYRKYNSPVMSMSKVIKLASALFSMLFLETAMFSQFGADTPTETKRSMILATGAGISVIVVVMAIYMIVRSTKELWEYRKMEKE